MLLKYLSCNLANFSSLGNHVFLVFVAQRAGVDLLLLTQEPLGTLSECHGLVGRTHFLQMLLQDVLKLASAFLHVLRGPIVAHMPSQKVIEHLFRETDTDLGAVDEVEVFTSRAGSVSAALRVGVVIGLNACLHCCSFGHT